jgi:hypothetical protein
MQGNIGPVGLVEIIARQERMRIYIIVVFGKGRVTLALIPDQIVPVRK